MLKSKDSKRGSTYKATWSGHTQTCDVFPEYRRCRPVFFQQQQRRVCGRQFGNKKNGPRFSFALRMSAMLGSRRTRDRIFHTHIRTTCYCTPAEWLSHQGLARNGREFVHGACCKPAWCEHGSTLPAYVAHEQERERD